MVLLQGVGKLGGWLQEFSKFVLQNLEGHFYYDQNYFLWSERSWFDEESFCIFCTEWEGYIVVSCDCF
jgi:hypothetical protein